MTSSDNLVVKQIMKHNFSGEKKKPLHMYPVFKVCMKHMVVGVNYLSL